jgi:hypothetical protein
MNDKRIIFASYLSEALFGTLAVASILEKHPYWALAFLALARTSAAAKSFFNENK